MIQPLLRDDGFLADVAAARLQPDSLHLWWLGQSGFLLQWQGRHLLLDPYLSDSLTRKYASTDKPHVRMTERVIDPRRLSFVDAVTSSHNHTDHLDADTLLPLIEVNPSLSVVVPEANRQFVAERLKCDPLSLIGLSDGARHEAAGFTITGVPAAHEKLDRDEQGHDRYMGFIVNAGPYTIYHSGDCMLYQGIEDRLRPFKIDIALLPVNGSAPERRVAGNLDGRQAAKLAHDIGSRLAIPCHYDMFEFNTASPDEFVAAAQQLGQPFRVLRGGERVGIS